MKLHWSKRVLKHFFSSTCPPRDQEMAFWTHIRSVERGWPGWGRMGMATGISVLCNENAREYKFPAQRRFPQLWQSLPLMCAPVAYCAYDGAPPAFSSEQTKLSLQDRRAGSLDDDNSAPGQDPLPTISRDEPILALQDASERDKGLMWQDDDLPPSSDVCTRVLTANEQPKIVDILKTHVKVG